MEMLIQSEASEFNTHINKRIHFWPAFMHSVNDTLFFAHKILQEPVFSYALRNMQCPKIMRI